MRRSHAQSAEPAMEHALIRILLGLILIGVIFTTAMNYMTRFYDEALEVKEQMLADRYLISVRYVHQEWLLTGKDSEMKMEYILDDGVTKNIQVRVNDKGWPISVDSTSSALDCESLWRHFASASQESKDLEVTTDNIVIVQSFDECKYMKRQNAEDRLIFSYHPLSGEVHSINQNVTN